MDHCKLKSSQWTKKLKETLKPTLQTNISHMSVVNTYMRLIWDCHMGFYSSYGIFVVIWEYQISIWLSIWFSYGIIYHMGLSYGNFHHVVFYKGIFLILDCHMGLCNKFVKFHFHMGNNVSYGNLKCLCSFQIP